MKLSQDLRWNASRKVEVVVALLKGDSLEEVGRFKKELDWVKKLPDSVELKRQLIVPAHSQLSLRRQCELLGMGRANWYYHPIGESLETLELMRQIDRQKTRMPFY